MNTNEMRVAFKRIMAGEKAKLVVAPENWDKANAIFATLSPQLRSL